MRKKYKPTSLGFQLGAESFKLRVDLFRGLLFIANIMSDDTLTALSNMPKLTNGILVPQIGFSQSPQAVDLALVSNSAHESVRSGQAKDCVRRP